MATATGNLPGVRCYMRPRTIIRPAAGPRALQQVSITATIRFSGPRLSLLGPRLPTRHISCSRSGNAAARNRGRAVLAPIRSSLRGSDDADWTHTSSAVEVVSARSRRHCSPHDFMLSLPDTLRTQRPHRVTLLTPPRPFHPC
jgi:hypothetical protein